MAQLTPERVVELAVAYYESGLAVPGHGSWFQWRPKGPPLACVAMAAYLSTGQTCMPGTCDPQDRVIEWAQSQGLTLDSLQGLTLGWDGDQARPTDGLNAQLFRRANEIGMAARAALNPIRIPAEC